MNTKVATVLSLLLVATISSQAFADPISDAQKLQKEASQILRAGASLEVDPRKYAECVVKLEKAMDLTAVLSAYPK